MVTKYVVCPEWQVKVYATCYPVPQQPPNYPVNPTVNDYVSTYTTERFKYRIVASIIHKLYFEGNNFEGCVRVEDGSADDGNVWWTVWPRKQHITSKELIKWYIDDYPQKWIKLDYTFVEDENLPESNLADKPKILGGPD